MARIRRRCHDDGVAASSAPHEQSAGLSASARIRLLWRVWMAALRVQLTLRRHRLPEAVVLLGGSSSQPPLPPALLSRAVSRGLRIGPWQPRCLVRSLVLYQLLRAQGDPAELVIGLTERPESPDAHAWIELAGREIGPWPGRGQHLEMARYPRRT
jgi:hypothetical protein